MGNRSEERMLVEMTIAEFRSYSNKKTPDGLAFESYIVHELASYFHDKRGVKVLRSSKKQDEREGTDFFVKFDEYNKAIRCDFTFNFDNKDNMPFESKYTMDLAGTPHGYDHSVHFGVRTGNPHKRFGEPVIVIGMNMDASQIRKEIVTSFESEELIDPITHLVTGEAIIYDENRRPVGTSKALSEMVANIDDVYRDLIVAKDNVKHMSYDAISKTHRIEEISNGTLVTRDKHSKKDINNEIWKLKVLDIPEPEYEDDTGPDYD